ATVAPQPCWRGRRIPGRKGMGRRAIAAVPALASAAIAALSGASAAAAQAAPIPAPVEFERSAPAPGQAAAHASRAAATVRTGRHFNLVGLHWRGDGASAL